MIRLVLLDLGNVLVNHEFRRFAEAVAAGSKRPADEVQRHQDDDKQYERWETGRLSEVEFFEDLRSWLGWRKADVPRLKRLWNDMFFEIPGAEPALKQLCRSHRVWILSDTNPLHLRFLRREYPFITRAGRIITSFQTGMTKRDRRVFERIIHEAGCEPREVVFVDDRSHNVETARSVGMRGIVFTNWKEVRQLLDREFKIKNQTGDVIMATKKKAARKTAAAGTISYTTSNVFNASVAKVWAAATGKKHLKKHFLDDMRGEYKKGKKIGWFWKEWGWTDVEVVSYKKNKELTVKSPFVMGGKYTVTTRYEILKRKEDGMTVFRVHESGYPKKNLKEAFMMCEGWSEFHTGIKAYLMGVDLRKA